MRVDGSEAMIERVRSVRVSNSNLCATTDSPTTSDSTTPVHYDQSATSGKIARVDMRSLLAYHTYRRGVRRSWRDYFLLLACRTIWLGSPTVVHNSKWQLNLFAIFLTLEFVGTTRRSTHCPLIGDTASRRVNGCRTRKSSDLA